MRRENIIIAFSSDNIISSLTKMLTSEGFVYITVCKSGADVKKQVSSIGSGIIICGYKLKDMTLISLADDISENFSVLLIGNESQLQMCETDNIFKLHVPIHRQELLDALNIIVRIKNGDNLSHDNEKDEKNLLETAKTILILKYSMTEQQAHRYIQKKSMDTGIKMIEIAKIILEQ